MKAIIWSQPQCNYCNQAKTLFASKNIEYEERVIGNGWTKQQLLEAVPNARSVPQIFLDDKYIGGYTELRQFFSKAA